MQRDTLIEQKQAVVTCEELDEKDGYCAIMEAHNDFKKKADAKKGEAIYNCYKNQATTGSVATSTQKSQQ
jgi:hypothetical protein